MNIWNRLARIYDRTFSPVLNRDLRVIRELGEFKKSDAVLDYGGGTGRVAQAIQNDVARVVVADAAPEMVARAREKGIAAEVVSGLPTTFPDASFDKILVIEAFHHLPNHRVHLAEFNRLLKPGGTLLIEEPNPALWWTWIAFWIERMFEPTVYHAPDELRLLLEQNGFILGDVRRARFSYFVRAVRKERARA